MRARRFLLGALAPIAAIVFALAVAALALLLVDINPLDAFGAMVDFAASTESVISIINRATPLFISALAVAIGFKMNLFNIGVEGQYGLSALVAGAAGAAVALPAPLHVLFIMLVAMAVGSLWAAIAALLRTRRGVHEVISTIMLNFIAFGINAWLFVNFFRAESQSLLLATPIIPDSGQLPSLNPLVEGLGFTIKAGADLQSFSIIAVLLGIGYYLLVWRTRFGYDLRASGINPIAAELSGADPKKMVMRAMLLSGAVAGLVGMSPMLGFYHQYTQDFPPGLGFTGIAVALLGRNHPVGMGLGALLFGLMDRSALILDLEGVPREIVVIVQGVVVLAVVVAYEVVTRLVHRQEIRSAALATAQPAVEGTPA